MAAAAYRAGVTLTDERTGRVHRYEKRKGVKSAFILTPNGAPETLLSRTVLWNAAEGSENRKNSRVAREVILALPHELSDEQRAQLCRDMALYLIERYRVCVDVAIHTPCGDDPRNHHAHLLFTTREVGKEGLSDKTRVLDDKVSGPEEIEIIREVWETLANDALHHAGFTDIRIDRRSLEDQGVERIPQTHEGKASKNASAYESQLGQAFASSRQDEKEDDAEDGGEEDGSGESSSSSGSSDSQSPNLTSSIKEDVKGRKIDYPSIDQKQTRGGFNAEIKALNAQRAAFGDKPLKNQITQLDRLMARLDTRLEKLQTLEAKTSLKEALKKSITGAVKFAAELLTRRERRKAVHAFTAQEKQARSERQIARYGRDYKQGLNAQMNEMKQNMALVSAKKEDFRRYKAFVDSIDRDLKKHSPSITIPFKDHALPRQVTNKEINLKLHLKAEMIRSNIPEQFRVKMPATDKRQTLTNSTAVNKVLQTKGKPIRVEQKIAAKPETPKAVIKASAPRIRADFKQVHVQPTPKAQAIYKQPMPVRIKAFDKYIAERHKEKIQTAAPLSRRSDVIAKAEKDRKIWFTSASEKTRPMTDAIDKAMRQQNAAQPISEHTATERQDSFTKAQDKATTYETVREKTRQEAKEKRASVPPEYRAEPYDRPQDILKTKKPATSINFDSVSEPLEQDTPRPKMSNVFNKEASVTKSETAAPESHPEQAPNV